MTDILHPLEGKRRNVEERGRFWTRSSKFRLLYIYIYIHTCANICVRIYVCNIFTMASHYYSNGQSSKIGKNGMDECLAFLGSVGSVGFIFSLVSFVDFVGRYCSLISIDFIHMVYFPNNAIRVWSALIISTWDFDSIDRGKLFPGDEKIYICWRRFYFGHACFFLSCDK